MKLACWNIAGGYILRESLENAISYDKEDIDYFIKELSTEDADVIVLQESHTPIKQNSLSQSKIIAEHLEYSFVENHPYGRSHIKNGQQLSLAILSKFPIIQSYFHKVPNPSLSIVRPNGDTWVSFDVGFLVCTINYNGILINIASGHMVPFHYYKRDFSESAFENIRGDISNLFTSFTKSPSLIGADFNYNDIVALFPKVFENNLYKEAFIETKTTPGRGQQDHLLYSQQWNFINSEVRKTKTDHYLCTIEADLKL